MKYPLIKERITEREGQRKRELRDKEINFHHGDARPNEALTLFEYCNPRAYGRLPIACQRRSNAAGREEYLKSK